MIPNGDHLSRYYTPNKKPSNKVMYEIDADDFKDEDADFFNRGKEESKGQSRFKQGFHSNFY